MVKYPPKTSLVSLYGPSETLRPPSRITLPGSPASRRPSTMKGFLPHAMYFSTAFCISSGLIRAIREWSSCINSIKCGIFFPPDLHLMDLPHFDRAAIFQVGMIFCALHCLIEIGGFDDIKSAEDFLGFAVRTVGDVLSAVAHDLADVRSQARRGDGEWFLGPGDVLFERRLHLFGTEFRQDRRIAVKNQYELGHLFFSSAAITNRRRSNRHRRPRSEVFRRTPQSRRQRGRRLPGWRATVFGTRSPCERIEARPRTFLPGSPARQVFSGL